MIDFNKIEKVYFLGIGGIGMSAIARHFNHMGKKVFGYDRTRTVLTKELEAEGLKIHYQEDISILEQGFDLVVYTPAIPQNNIELQWFIDNNYDLYKRSEILGFLSNDSFCIAIGGTHGKTTTSSILSYLLEKNALNPSVFVGGIMKNYNMNYICGNSDLMVVEADEFDRSFLRLTPDIAVILSIDADHLDIYGDSDSVIEGFKMFTDRIQDGGELWIAATVRSAVDDQWLTSLLVRGVNVRTFGIDQGDVHAQDVRVENSRFQFEINRSDAHFELGLPGRHNVSNATVSLGIAHSLGVPYNQLAESLKGFEGIRRRFDVYELSHDRVLIDDYAHHPTEIRAAIHATKELFPDRHVTTIFQPHLYTRTRDFDRDFGEELSKNGRVALLPIYPARELPIEGVTSESVLGYIDNEEKYAIEKEEIIPFLDRHGFDVLLMLGAGDIDKEIVKVKDHYAA